MNSSLKSALFAASKNCLLALTAIAAMLASSPGYASTFNFSFTNDAGNVSGTVTGEIVLNSTNTAATEVLVTSYPSALTLGISAPFDAMLNGATVVDNQFTVDSSGNLTSEHFNSGSANFFLRIEAADFQLDAGPSPNGSSLVATNAATFTPVVTPLPAALTLFGTGLGAIGLLGWRRKRKAQAVVA